MLGSMVDPSEPWEDLVGIRAWPGRLVPLILVAQPDQIEPIAQNCPRAHVVSLPADCELWTTDEAWPMYLPAFQADLALWPVTAADEAILRAAAPALDLAGVRTLRWVTRRPDDWARYESVSVVWRDRAPLR